MSTNRLAGETSPYLRQHADNPVEWYPWGPEAFEAARTRDVPILLSVGYSACHWCHVMAHESFEDPGTAAVMNELFVNVKVDREERPDVDAVYMEAVQAITGSGGWPMTVFLLPDGRPFFGGTYFPRDRFVDLLMQVRRAWLTRRAGLEDDAGRLAEAVAQAAELPGAGQAGTVEPGALLVAAADAVLGRFDPEWGGIGRAPKFPQAPMLDLLLHAGVRTGRRDYLDAATTTLDAMASGGIYDHLGGGFARYSTDRRWLVPHFEKMLYDNALLARTYARAAAVTGSAVYRQVAEETVAYLLRPPLRRPDGGLCSAEDADSEGEEGRFYVWSHEELVAVGGTVAAEWYGASEEGNWEGRCILWRPRRGDLRRPPEVEAARAELYRRRETRVRPGLDDKVLTEWNAMAVAALAEAGGLLARPDWVGEAETLADFLLANLRVAGRWQRSWQEGDARHLAYAADHAWLVEAFTRLGEASGRRRWTDEAVGAAEQLLGLFWDGTALRTTGSDAEALIARTADATDGALPSASSVAATALLRLGALTGRSDLSDAGRRLVDSLAAAVERAPLAFAGTASAADLAARGLTEIVVSGRRPDLVEVARAAYRPVAVLAWGEPYGGPLWEGRSGPGAEGLAYVCRNHACDAPVSTAGELERLLGS